jgi:hypothetical protein
MPRHAITRSRARRASGQRARLVPPLLGAAVACALTACDPYYSYRHRQVLRPAPAAECVASALRSSPLVAVVAADSTSAAPKSRAEQRFIIAIRDSTKRGGHWDVWLEQEPDSAEASAVSLTYGFMSYDTPRDAARTRLDSLSRALLVEVKGACAPASPDTLECRVSGLGSGRMRCGADAALVGGVDRFDVRLGRWFEQENLE